MTRPTVTQNDNGVLRWDDEGGMPRGNNAAHRLSEPMVDALARAAISTAQAIPVAPNVETPQNVKVLLPTVRVIRRHAGSGGMWLRMCKCNHAGIENFRNGDESKAFETITAPDWVCGWCAADVPNPGKFDAAFADASIFSPEIERRGAATKAARKAQRGELREFDSPQTFRITFRQSGGDSPVTVSVEAESYAAAIAQVRARDDCEQVVSA